MPISRVAEFYPAVSDFLDELIERLDALEYGFQPPGGWDTIAQQVRALERLADDWPDYLSRKICRTYDYIREREEQKRGSGSREEGMRGLQEMLEGSERGRGGAGRMFGGGGGGRSRDEGRGSRDRDEGRGRRGRQLEWGR